MTVTPIRKVPTIGGSDAAAAAGIHPHVSRVALWLEKTGRIERVETEAMRWGAALEPLIFERLVEDHDVTPSNGANEYRDAQRDWLVGHPDGYMIAGDPWQSVGIVEVKTANVYAARAWEGVPLEYAAQCQVYMYLTGMDRALLAVLVGGQRLEVTELRRDDKAIRLLLARLDDFYGYLLADKPPPPDGSDSARAALLAMFPEHREGEKVRLHPRDLATVEELRRRKAQRDTLDAQIRERENRLKALMGEAELAITMHDDEVIRWRTSTVRRVDVERLKRDRPDVYAEYLTETQTRRFTLL